MSYKQFWETIDTTHEMSGSDPQKQHDLILEILAQGSERDLWIFDDIARTLWMFNLKRDYPRFRECHPECSDEDFENFLEWVIAQGEAFFKACVENPEYLIDVLKQQTPENIKKIPHEMLTEVAVRAQKLRNVRTGGKTNY